MNSKLVVMTPRQNTPKVIEAAKSAKVILFPARVPVRRAA